VIERWGIRIVLALIVGAVLGGGALAAAPAHADVNDFSFDSLHTDYRLTRAANGRADLAVTETFVADFPADATNHGIERAIPTTADGRSLHVQVRGVTDASGDTVQWQTETDDVPAGFTVLRIGDPYSFVQGRQTYVISYTMRDVIHQQRGGAQQFLFDVNGTGWQQRFGTVTATLHVPAALAGSLSGDTACYQGAQGSTARCAITRTAGGFDVSASGLGAHENVTMSVGFEAGTFEVPLSVARLLVWVALGLALVLLALALVVRLRQLGNPKGTGIIVPQYQAFPGIGVMEAAELLDERDRAFPALITQLVVSRAATMTRDDRGTEKTKDDLYSLTLLDATVLDDEDADAAHTLFGSIKPGAHVTLNPAKPKIGDRIAKLLRNARDAVRKQHLIARRVTPASGALLGAAALVFLCVAVLFFVTGLLGYLAWQHEVALGAAVLLALAAGALVLPLERRTESATPAYEHLLGIRDYLRLAEADRIRMLQTPTGAETRAAPDGTEIVKLYEKLLPYAILFNIEKEWRAVLGGYWATTPTDVSPTLLPLQTLVFANAFASGNFATTASTTSNSHSWSSSGGSGFSGGFSGGGFGGGGGGGW
jgi:uncharacterized membrane protein YgcG